MLRLIALVAGLALAFNALAPRFRARPQPSLPQPEHRLSEEELEQEIRAM